MKFARTLRRLGAALMLGVLASCGSNKPADDTINFSILSTESSENLMPKWKPFLDDMRRKTGLKIEPFFADDYAGLIEAMRFGRVQVGWFSNKSGLEALNRANGEVFAQSSYSDGQPGYYSIILVKKSGPIKSVDDLLKCDKSLDFGMGDPVSTSGYLVPLVYLFAPRNIEPERCFKTVVSQNHEANSLSVYNGLIDAATNNTTNVKALQRTRPEVVAGLREIWRSPMLGLDPVIYRKDLDPKIKQKLRDFFVNYGREGAPEEVKRERAVLASLEWGTFNPADDHILDQVREIDLRKELYDLRGDRSAKAAERRAAIEADIAKLTAR